VRTREVEAQVIPERQPRDSPFLYVAIALCSAVVFAADLLSPRGVADWIFYLAPLMATLLLWRPFGPPVVAAAQTVLVVAGFFLKPGEPNPTTEINRLFAVIIVWILAGAATFFIRGKLSVRRQEWLQAGQIGLNIRMAGEQNLEQLGSSILAALAEYTGAQVGAVFCRENGRFTRAAAYALPDEASLIQNFTPGEGFLGQAAKDKRPFVVNDVPEGYLKIGSALGGSRPRNLLIAPALADEEVKAVIELGFLTPVDEAVVELLNLVSSPIALRVRSVKIREQLQALLEETQRQAEELQAQGEELRASNEELEQQANALQQSHARLEQQQIELALSNNRIAEHARMLEAQTGELTQAKAALEQQARQLQLASKYKSEFLARMSHELRTPLNSSLILARLLFENRTGNLTKEQVEYARSIEASGNALLNLINDVLDLAKVESGRLEIRTQHVAVARIAESMRVTFAPIASEKGIRFTVQLAQDLPAAIETDSQRLEQVLKNLISNGIKFTDVGEVSLAISRAGRGRIRFAVRDTGIGIPQEEQEIIFQEFRQASGAHERQRSGTGLGLSISRELVRLLGGEISVQSRVGEGSTFSVVIPEFPAPMAVQEEAVLAEPQELRASAAAGDSGTAAPSQRRIPPPAWNLEDDRETLTGDGRTILIVEDDELFAQILRDLARELQFQCLLAPTAEDGLILAQQFSPSGILLDIGLPDHSGLSLLDRLKSDSRTRHIPVHVVSIHDYVETALSLGAVGYAIKPAKREELVAAFRRLEHKLAQKLRRLLIVEDDPVQQESLRQLLETRDVETVPVRTAAECLEQLRVNSFDCMVLDLNLPDQSGLQLLERISREDRYSFPPVIVYTGRELSLEEEQALRRHSKSIIVKGAKSPERLLDEVTLFLHQVIADLPPDKQRLIQQARGRDAILEGRSVLLVEDDVRNIFALSSILEPKGVKLKIARNGREAIEIIEGTLKPGGEPVDLVLMDVMMPEMDGLTATREIRKRKEWKQLPIIMLTAKAMKGDQQEAIQAGANEWLSKPLDVDQLLSVMRVWMPR
jgi:signal transduction histidine kinase/DNA-binding response OmpR family regulator